MKRTFNPLEVQEKFPQIPLLDIHYYGLKGYGVANEHIDQGHPKFHLVDGPSFFSIVPLISSPDSPYIFTDALRFGGEELPFRVKNIPRVNKEPYYFYFRGIQEWIPTLDAETILSVNFQPQCGGCEFCSREPDGKLPNINAREGIELAVEKDVDLTLVDKITVVTGMFKSESEVVSHIDKIVRTAREYGYMGRMLYIGLQIRTPQGIRDVLEATAGMPFKYAYSLESFTRREIMHKAKRDSVERAIDIIEKIRGGGVEDLEYSYIPGIDSIDDFMCWAPKLVSVAQPHLSIFRPATKRQVPLRHDEFFDHPVEYLCEMRQFYEKLYDGPILANNLANLWGFPVDRLNPVLLSDKIKYK